MKALVIGDPGGRLSFYGETRPGSMHDLTQARTAGLVDLLPDAPLGVQVLADAGYQGLDGDTAGAVTTPKLKPRKHHSHCRRTSQPHTAARTRHSSQRIRVEHAIGHPKNRRTLAPTTADANTSTTPLFARSPAYCQATNTPTAPRTPPSHSSPTSHTSPTMSRPAVPPSVNEVRSFASTGKRVGPGVNGLDGCPCRPPPSPRPSPPTSPGRALPTPEIGTARVIRYAHGAGPEALL
ncbi:transposase family protein [Micromonospora chokoriensis]